jgi:hypothetical protein
MFYFQAADMVTQILNFGIPAQIDVRTVGYDRAKNLQVANELRQRIATIPGVADDTSFEESLRTKAFIVAREGPSPS